MDFSHLLLVEFWQAGISPMSVPDLWLKHEASTCGASTAFAASAGSAAGGLLPSFSECVGKGSFLVWVSEGRGSRRSLLWGKLQRVSFGAKKRVNRIVSSAFTCHI